MIKRMRPYAFGYLTYLTHTDIAAIPDQRGQENVVSGPLPFVFDVQMLETVQESRYPCYIRKDMGHKDVP